jgi:hypothetical protein
VTGNQATFATSGPYVNLPNGLFGSYTAVTMEAWLAAPAEPTLTLSTRLGLLDGDTVGSAVELNASRGQEAHALASSAPDAIAFTMSGTRLFLPLVVTNEALEWSGGYADWMTATNERTTQLLRIKLREELACNRACPLNAGSELLTLALIQMTLDVMESIPAGHAGAVDDTSSVSRTPGVSAPMLPVA